MNIEIIKNYEMPAHVWSPNGGRPKYPFDCLEVGDGFELADDKGKTPTGGSLLCISISKCIASFVKRNPGQKFVTRVDKKRGVVCCRREA